MSATPLQLAVLISGNGSNLQAIIDRIKDGSLNASVSVVISNKADAYGLQRAQTEGIATVVVEAAADEPRVHYDERLAQALDQHEHGLIVLAGFMRIFSDAFVQRYRGKMINIHPSLLPKYKGLNTHQRVLEAGDTEHGASVHWVTPTLDDGPVIEQAVITVEANDTIESLKSRVQKKEHLLYPDVIRRIANGEIRF